MPFVKFEVTDDEMIISVLVFVSNLFHEEIKAVCSLLSVQLYNNKYTLVPGEKGVGT